MDTKSRSEGYPLERKLASSCNQLLEVGQGVQAKYRHGHVTNWWERTSCFVFGGLATIDCNILIILPCFPNLLPHNCICRDDISDSGEQFSTFLVGMVCYVNGVRNPAKSVREKPLIPRAAESKAWLRQLIMSHKCSFLILQSTLQDFCEPVVEFTNFVNATSTGFFFTKYNNKKGRNK